MISKGCPKCKAQVAVACKSCPCGHIFFTARNRGRTLDSLIISAAGSSSDAQTGQRRTERVKREKPKFYDSLQYENKLKKRRKPKTVQPVYEDNKEDEEDDDSDPKGKKRRILKKHKEEIDDPMANLSAEKLYQCTIELAELNRKISSASWRV